MATGTDGSAGQSLEDFAGQMFGELEGSDDTTAGTTDDSSSAVAAGAPPAEHAESPSGQAPTGSEAQSPAVAAGAPPAEHANASADQAAPAAPLDDPLAGATPFTYVVNGETRTFDGIKVIPELGGIIDAGKLPDLMRRLGERDHLFETSQQHFRATQDRDRLTEWTLTKTDGSKETLTGLAADRARMESHANVLAELKTLKDALADPEQFQQLLAFDEANNRVVLNTSGLKVLSTMAENLAMKMHQAIGARFASAQTSPRAAAAAEPDIPAIAPNVVATVVQRLNVTGLTDKDTAKLAAMVPRYIRPATEADRQQNPTLRPGEKVIDPAFFDEVKYLADLRAEAATTTRVAADASTTNAARLAAAARGKPAPRTPAAPAAPQRPANARAQEAGDAWDLMEKLSNRAVAAKVG